MGGYNHKIWEPCQGGPLSPQVVASRGGRRLREATYRGNLLRDYLGCCIGSSKTIRSLCMPISHFPVQVGEHVSRRSKNGNTQVQKASHQGYPAQWHIFLLPNSLKTPALPFLSLCKQEQQMVQPKVLSSKSEFPDRDNQTVQECPLEEDKFTEFSTEETVNRTKRSSMFTVLRIEAIQKTKLCTKSG